jgi:rhodanese-related sulfurtransferase
METTTQRQSTITPIELKSMLDGGRRVQIIDVRSATEFEEGHVPGAVNMPLEQVESRLADLHPADPAVLVCQSGTRAQMCHELLERHRSDLTVLTGGTSAWVEEGLPIVRSRATRLPLMRQVQIVAGSMAFAGAALGYFADPRWGFLAMFVGVGLMLAGSTGFCGMAVLLKAMPWNRARPSNTAPCAVREGG